MAEVGTSVTLSTTVDVSSVPVRYVLRKSASPTLPDGILQRDRGTGDLSTTWKIFSVLALREHAHPAGDQRVHQGGHRWHDIFATGDVGRYDLEESRPAQEIIGIGRANLKRAVVIIDGNTPP